MLGSRGDTETKIEQNTRKKIREIEDNVNKNKEYALKKLLDFVYDIQPELHQNLRLDAK